MMGSSDTLFALFLAGLLGGGHCMAMCGGVMSAFGLKSKHSWTMLLGYNLGRLSSYAFMGALMGGLGQWMLLSTLIGVKVFLAGLAGLMLLLMGASLLGWNPVLSKIETWGGRWIWARLQPFAARHLPIQSISQAYLMGAVWGWLPCGLVYSASLSALGTGHALQGAELMLAFGLGTLPNLIFIGRMAQVLQGFFKNPQIKTLFGMALIGMGLLQWWNSLHLFSVVG